MKLYYSPGVCSLSPHIVLRELGQTFDLVHVDLPTKKTAHGQDFHEINPKGYVPVLELDNGEFLTEGVAIVNYLADSKPEAGLSHKYGTMERLRLDEWLLFITTELHKGFGPFFKSMGEEAKNHARKQLSSRFDYLSAKLKGKEFLFGDRFTLADSYLFTVLSWSKPAGVDLSPWPVLVKYLDSIATRPSVQDAMMAEGLIKTKAA